MGSTRSADDVRYQVQSSVQVVIESGVSTCVFPVCCVVCPVQCSNTRSNFPFTLQMGHGEGGILTAYGTIAASGMDRDPHCLGSRRSGSSLFPRSPKNKCTHLCLELPCSNMHRCTCAHSSHKRYLARSTGLTPHLLRVDKLTGVLLAVSIVV